MSAWRWWRTPEPQRAALPWYDRPAFWGTGLFFAFAPNDGVQQTNGYVHRFENQIFPDGRSDFVPNWFGRGATPEGEWGGPKPSWEQSLQRACDLNPAQGTMPRARAPG